MDYLSTIVPSIADGLQVTLKNICHHHCSQPAFGDYYGPLARLSPLAVLRKLLVRL